MHIRVLKNRAPVIIIAVCFFISCNKGIVYNDFRPVPDKVWEKQFAFDFHFDMKDTSVPYDITLQLRNNDFYPYQNLWIILDELHQSEIEIQDTIEYRLVDNSGRWTGNGISLFQNQFPLRTNYHFPDTGKYTISIRHGMFDDRLKGIEDIGLQIRASK